MPLPPRVESENRQMIEATERLRQLAEDNNHFADLLENNERLRTLLDIPDDRRLRLVRMHEHYGQCLSMAAWLLERDMDRGG